MGKQVYLRRDQELRGPEKELKTQLLMSQEQA